ncbi:MAG: sulfite oxidase-like oxidoreductase [Terriglobia bacterium]
MNIFANNAERKRVEEAMRETGRLPPGQVATLKWPVLHYGTVPGFEPQSWDFRVWGRVEQPLRLSWGEFQALPQLEVLADMHCVTRWSRFDNRWEGVAAREVIARARPRPEARYALVHAESFDPASPPWQAGGTPGRQGYTANVPLKDLLEPKVLFALKHDAELLTPEHGYPLRLVVPHLYSWKSVKWVRGLELLADDEPGFWEQNGYHRYGDPWNEQRYDTD